MLVKVLLLHSLAFFFLSSNALAQPTVCVASINSEDEEQVMREELTQQGFKFINLLDFQKEGTNWIDNACNHRDSNGEKIRCDVKMISAHFAERFVGDKGQDAMLKLTDLEKWSCQKDDPENNCSGILNPTEVFLMGCNTLAGKEVDRKTGRTIDQYMKNISKYAPADLVQDIAMSRFGPIGSSNQDRVRSVYGDTTKIYAFADTAPTGPQIRKYFRNYFKKINDQHGNYEQHLEKTSLKKIENQRKIAEGALDLLNNTTLKTEVERGSGNVTVITCNGLSAGNAQEKKCFLFNNDPDLLPSNVEQALDLLASEDADQFLPQIAEFFKKNHKDIVKDPEMVRDIQFMLQNSDAAKNLKKMLDELNEFDPDNKVPNSRINLIYLQHLLEHQDGRKEELGKKLKSALKDKNGKLPALVRKNSNIFCEIYYVNFTRMPVSSSDFNEMPKSVDGIAPLRCTKIDQRSGGAFTQAANDIIKKDGAKLTTAQRLKMIRSIQDFPYADNFPELNTFITQQASYPKSDSNKNHIRFQTYAHNNRLLSTNPSTRDDAAIKMLTMNSSFSLQHLLRRVQAGEYKLSPAVIEKAKQIRQTKNPAKNHYRYLTAILGE